MLMSVVMEHTNANKHAQTLLEAILVYVILDIYWRQIRLHAVVCAHLQMSIHACNTYFYTYIYTCFIQILMSVLTEQIIAPKNVQTLTEVSFVDVTLGFSWITMGLHVMVCRRNNYIHIAMIYM